MNTQNKQRLHLFIIMVLVAVAVGAIAVRILYIEHYNDHKRELIHIVKSRAGIIGAVARFDRKYSSNFPAGTREATISQIRDAHENFEGFGNTGEFALAEKQNNKIHFLLTHRHKADSISLEDISFDDPRAEPMRRSLNKESGTVTGLDYRGVEVLAAYEPVEELDLGLVAKVDISEIQKPFIKTVLTAGGGGLIVIILGTLAFFRTSEPLIQSIRESEERFRAMFIKSPLGIAEINSLTGQIYEVNDQFANIVGRTKEEVATIDWMSITHPDDIQLDLDNMAKLNSGEVSEFSMKKRYLRADGSVVWINLTVAPLRVDAKGNPRHLALIEDIDDRVRSEENIKKLSSVVKQSPAVVVITDTDGIIEYVNPAFTRTTGYTAEEAIGQNPRILKSGVTPDHEYKELWETITSGKEWSGTFYNKRKDGTLFWENASVAPLKNDQGEITHFIAVKEDITELKQGAEEVQKLSRVVNESPIAILITDSKGDIEYVNASLLNISGYSRNEVIGKNPRMFSSEESPKEYYEGLWSTISGGTEWRGVFHNKKKNGDLYWESVLVTPLKDKEGNVTNYIGLKEDITEKKRLESTLIDHERLIRSVIENLKDGLVIINKSGLIQMFNSGAEAIFGYESHEVMNKNVSMLIPESDVSKHLEGFESLATTGQSRILSEVLEVTGQSKEGKIIPIELQVTKMEQRGETLFIGNIRDISAKKLNEEKLRIAQTQVLASQKLAAVGELSAGVSHEVLNPMNIISVHTQMLSRKKRDDETIQIFCKKVGNEVNRIKKIMGGLLEFSRKGDAKLERGTLRDDIEKVLDLVEREYELDNVKIVREWCDKLVEIEYDPDKIRQVFLNLMNNAKHALPSGGTITVGCDSITQSGKKYHRFRFGDTGHGMSEDVRSKVFDPFFTTKPQGEGTGMGLSIVYGIIEEHGGKIAVESEEGKGTTFYIDLPLAD